MKGKIRTKKTWIVLALVAVLAFSSLGAVQAYTTPDYMSAAMSLAGLNSMVANLDAADVQDLVAIGTKMNNALFNGINGNPAVLGTAEKQCLYNTYSINQSFYPMIINGGFVYYIDNATSHGNSDYDGFIDAVQTNNLDYLADLLMFTNDAVIAEAKNQFEFYGLNYVDQLALFSQLMQVKYEPGLAFTPSVTGQYEAILQDIVTRSSGGDAQLTEQMLAGCGISVGNIEAVFNQLSDEDKQALEDILDKMGLIIHTPDGGLTATFEPADGATDVPVASNVKVTFNKDVSEVDLQGITIMPSDDVAMPGLSYNIAGNVLTINHPDFDFLTGYTVTIPAGAVKSAADELNEQLNWSFTTVAPGQADKPTVTLLKPEDGAEDVLLNATVKAKFNMAVSEEYLSGITITTEDGELTGVSAQVSGKVLTISHPDFDYLTEYTVNVPAGAVKSSADVLNDSFSWAFTTIQESIVIGDYVLTVDTDKAQYYLDENVNVSGFLYKNDEEKKYLENITVGLVLSKGETEVLFGQVATDENGKYEWVIPAANLELGDYTIFATSELATGQADFSVVQKGEPPTGKPVIEKYVPEKDDTGVSLSTEVSATFNMDVTAVELDGIKIETDEEELSGVTATLDGRVLKVSHPKFDYSTYYTVIIPAGTVKNATGDLNDADEWTFKTRSRNSSGGGSNRDRDRDDECTFTDLRTSHWAYELITGLCKKGIVNGYPNGTFQPDGTITRAELTKLFVEAKDLRIIQPETPTFQDVAPNAWYYKYVETAADAGLVKGYENGEFHPDAKITRQEIAAIVARAMDLEKEAEEAAFENTGFKDDEQIASWAKGYVVIEKREGIIDGYPDNTFGPLNNATRAEACAMLSRFMRYMED